MKSMQTLARRVASINPVGFSFFASLVLSVIAVQFSVTIGKDTAFYFDVAQIFNEHGLRAAFTYFNWPWMSVLFGLTQRVTGLSWLTVGHLWATLFMATTGALLVSLVTRRVPGSGGWAVLVVLAMPAVNGFRGDILREHGFWCFCVLAMWLAFAWDARGGWARALAMQAAVLAAALFRLEAVVLMPALVLWRLLLLKQPDGGLRLVQMALVPVLVTLGGLVALLTLEPVLVARAHSYFSYFLNPVELFSNFTQVSQQFGDILSKWAADETGTILFFGFLGTLAWRFVRLLGPFAVPFLLRDGWRAWGGYGQRFAPMLLAWALYFGVMLVFFFQMLFINSRYSALLNLLATPLAVLAMMNLAQRFPRAVKALVAVCLVVMLANVVSFSAKKTHYLEAAQWFAQHSQRAEESYFDDRRIAWYAGLGYRGAPLARADALSDMGERQLRYYALEARPNEPWLLEWLARHANRCVLAQFANRKGATVVIIGACADAPT